MLEQIFQEEMLVTWPLRCVVEGLPNSIALTDVDKDRSWTYNELNRQANKLAHALLAEGLTKDTVIMGSLFNTPEFVLTILASYKTGAVFSPLNPRLAPGGIAYSWEDSGPKIYIYDSAIEDVVKKAQDLTTFRPHKIVSTNELDKYIAGKPEDDPKMLPGVTPFDECLRLYTSGTTGKAKGVPHNHINMRMAGIIGAGLDQWNQVEQALVLSPWFHAAGAEVAVHLCWSVGAHLFGMKNFDPVKALEAIQRYKISFIVAAPPMFVAMSKMVKGQPGKWDTSSLRGIDSMGAPITMAQYREWQQTLCKKVWNSDGSTEFAQWGIKFCPWHPEEKIVTNGPFQPDCMARVVKMYPDHKADPSDVVPKDGKTEGELIQKGITSADHYHNKPEKTKETFRDGWLYTNDVAVWDADGFITIKGRTDEMIISGAENIYPDEVEGALMEHPKVADAFVVGLPDEVMGQVATAYIVRKDPSLTVAELDAFCKSHPMLPRFKRPRYYKFVDEVPYNATGKRMRFMVREDAIKSLAAGELEKV